MNAKVQPTVTEDPWEDRVVGAEEEFVEVMPDQSQALELALDLHPISIRLQKSLVDNLKALAQLHGLGYQPLIRQVLTRWVDSELKLMLVNRVNERNSPTDAPESSSALGLEAGKKPAATRRGGQVEPKQKKAA